MPPKAKVTKDQLIAAGLDIVRSGGPDALNARAIAKKLGISTQPIFSHYSSMDALREDVITAANDRYTHYLEAGMADPSVPPYKASGMAYIRFAKEERELFKLLFMRDRTGERISEDRASIAPLLDLITANTGFDRDAAYHFHLEMWVYVHGLATMTATGYLDWDWDIISTMLTDAFQGLIERYRHKGGNRT